MFFSEWLNGRLARNRYVVDLRKRWLPASVGNKAKHLRQLIDHDFLVPGSYVCLWEAYLRYRRGDSTVLQRVKEELAQQIDEDQVYAVRSSANLEDSFDHSFAGQFKSVLRLQGVDQILAAIQSIWVTTHSRTSRAYLQRKSLSSHDVRMAVIIQEMVSPVISGVAFSKNPLTGLDEAVVEAVTGSGEALVQDGVTTWRWINRRGAWLARPEADEVDPALIQHVVDQTRKISQTFQKNVDLEWVYDGQHLYWVQLREITTTKQVNVYSDKFSREYLPGIIKPLVWSVNVPLVNGAWVKLLTEVIGPNEIEPKSLAKSFYYRAYFNTGRLGQIFACLGLPRESLEIVMGLGPTAPTRPTLRPSRRMIRLAPRLVGFLIDKWRFARKIDSFLPALEAQYRSFKIDRASQLSQGELLAAIDRLYLLTQEAAYYNIVGQLLMALYSAGLRSQLKKVGVDAERFDLLLDPAELEQIDPKLSLSRLGQQFNQLEVALQAKIRSGSYDEFQQLPGIGTFQQDVAAFIDRFGHLADRGNDFSIEPWRENPSLVLQLLPAVSRVDGKRSQPLNLTQWPAWGPRRWLLNLVVRRARQFRLYREQINFVYTYGYGLFRVYFLALGDHFVQQSGLVSRTDIFYLSWEEVREIVTSPATKPDYRRVVAQRKLEIEQCRDIVLPSIIYGDEVRPLAPSIRQTLKGTPTSRGCYTGPVKVVQGIQDFKKLASRDVLVVPYSDIGWTPLFIQAGAVVAESGGLLSHSSIVAREYGIPAVVSVNGACQLQDNTLVTVDGDSGEIIIHQAQQKQSAGWRT